MTLEPASLGCTGLSPSHVFQSGEGISPYHIRCQNNPYDLRPAVDLILKAADDKRENLPMGTPLAIIIGEDHAVPYSKPLVQLLSSRLLEREEEFTVNLELEHNLWSTIALTKMNRPVPEGLYHNNTELDSNGRGSLSAFTGYWRLQKAPVSYHSLSAFCYHHKIATFFNDAARHQKYFLDLSDPDTLQAAQDSSVIQKKIHIESMEGMTIRNLVMARRGMAGLQKEQANTLIQHIGILHLFKNAASPYSSLCEEYERHGVSVLPVFISTRFDHYGVNRVYPESYPWLSKAVIIDDAPENKFSSLFLFRIWKQEERGLKKFCMASGHDVHFYNAAEEQEKYRDFAKNHYDEIYSAYQATLKPAW